MAQDKKISELEHRLTADITGLEMIPYEDEDGNGNVTIADIRGYLQSDVVQTTGDSKTQVMSQQAVTRKLNLKVGFADVLNDSAFGTGEDRTGSGDPTRPPSQQAVAALFKIVIADLAHIGKAEEAIADLQKSVWPLTLDLSLSASLLEYTGSAQSVTVTRAVKKNNSAIAASDIASASMTLTNTSGTSTIDSSTANPRSVTIQVNSYGSSTVSSTATAYGMTATASRSVRMELPMYFGFASADATGSLGITSLGKQRISTTASGTYTLINDTAGKHLWLCVPQSMTINKVTSSGFDVPLLAAQSKSTSLGAYKCYRTASTSGINAGALTITIE